MPNACDSIPEKKPSLLLQWTLPASPPKKHIQNKQQKPPQPTKKTKTKKLQKQNKLPTNCNYNFT